VATIGNFDGVHLGHRAILRRLGEWKRELGLPATVISFEPLPREYFGGRSRVARLVSLREKLELLHAFGVDRLLCLRFNEGLADLEAEAFVENILVAGLAVKHLVIGDDFRFGRGRSGDEALLERLGHTRGFGVSDAPTIVLDGGRVSSTRIRAALAVGDLDLAGRLLGRPYRLSGRVMHGDERGRLLGFPTANLAVRPRVALSGVYAVTVRGAVEDEVRGIANLGRRPTVGGEGTRLEVHLLDFSGDLYGRRLEVSFLHKLRDECRFDSLEMLTAQIRADREQALEFFGNR
jgi:riboflavin kinase/FMN adenylyltransferase